MGKYRVYPNEIAKALYQLSVDMDYSDYEESREQTINDLTYIVEYIESASQNLLNNKAWSTFYDCIQQIAESIELNNSIVGD